ncbi:MAG: response regulator [Terriglobales bacterium]
MKLQPFPFSPQRSNHPPPLPTILLVEDEPFVREATRCILESAGFKVLAAEDAAAALKMYEESGAIHLVVTDMILPGRTGEQLGEELRQRAPNIRVLITSGYSQAGQTTENVSANTSFLAKPYSRSELVGKISEILNPPPLRQVAGQAG